MATTLARNDSQDEWWTPQNARSHAQDMEEISPLEERRFHMSHKATYDTCAGDTVVSIPTDDPGSFDRMLSREKTLTFNQQEATPNMSKVSVSDGTTQEGSDNMSHKSSPREDGDINDRLGMRESLGLWGCTIIIGGALCILAGLAIIIFLWTGKGSENQGAGATHAWRSLMLHGWIEQATTLCTLLIQVAGTTQGTVCTAMLAALFLEKYKVRKSQVAHFSVMRGINEGPRRLAELLLFSKEGLWRWESLLVFSLTLTTIALQFGSTILFSDLRQTVLARDIAPFQVQNYIPKKVTELYITYISLHPPTYATYGEVQTNATSAPDALGFSDTGLKQRALLPFRESTNRTSIHSYQGNSVVLQSRAVCMPPKFDGAFTGNEIDNTLNEQSMQYSRVNGTLRYGESLRNTHSVTSLCGPDGCQETDFDCSIPGAAGDGWSSSYCLINSVGGSFLHNDQTSNWPNLGDPWSNSSMIFLVFTTNVFYYEWADLQSLHNISSSTSTENAEWTSFQVQEDRYVNMSLCFMTYNSGLSSVSMTSSGTLHEPNGNWSMTGDGDSSEARRFFGADPGHQSHAERGILTIDSIKEAERLSPLVPSNSSTPSNQTLAERTASDYEDGLWSSLTFSGTPSTSWQACIRCYFHGSVQDPEFSMLVGDTIKTTGRAADALQAWLTAYGVSFYTEFLTAFSGAEEAQIAFTKTVQTAGACRDDECKGLISVICIVVFHLVCVFVTLALYLRQVRYSRQGEIWHAVSQLSDEDMRGVLDDANNMDDSAVSRRIKREEEDVFVKLGRSESGRITFMRVPDRPPSRG
ncbi:hypothetical protein M426DRAFT_325730 [Hypoxylon sp. CI-4A]|nr:hypothetical protein M426DRAFT_325730 [Hypoxylon sp. CI-4A]